MGYIKMMVLCNAKAITDHDRRRSGLPSAPLNTEYDINITEVLSCKHTT